MKRRPEPACPSVARLRGGLLAGLLSLLLPALAGAEQTIAYEPTTVTLTGTLHGGTFVHPKGEHVPFWFLRLREPVAVPADPANSINEAASGVKEIHVYSTDESLRRRLKRRLGHRVSVDGTVFHQHTAWHVRTLVMQVTALHDPGPGDRSGRDVLPESVAK